MSPYPPPARACEFLTPLSPPSPDARTCESLGVESLVLSNLSVTGTDAFRRQSVTSERWLTLREVGRSDLPAFIRECKEQGYTVIGAPA